MFIFATAVLAAAMMRGELQKKLFKQIEREKQKAWGRYMANNVSRMRFRTQLKRDMRSRDPNIPTSKIAALEEILMNEMMEQGDPPPGWQWWMHQEGYWVLLPPGWATYKVERNFRKIGFARFYLMNKYVDPNIMQIEDMEMLDQVNAGRGIPSLFRFDGSNEYRFEDDPDANPYKEGGLKILEWKNPDRIIQYSTLRQAVEVCGPMWQQELEMAAVTDTVGRQIIPNAVIVETTGVYGEEPESDMVDMLEKMGIYVARSKDGNMLYPSENFIDLPLEETMYYRGHLESALRMGLRMMWIPDSFDYGATRGRWYVIHPIPENVPEWFFPEQDSIQDRERRDEMARQATGIRQYISDRRQRELGLIP